MEHLKKTYVFGDKHASTNELGMRPMQAEVYANRKKQYILLKAPPASGKSRAFMYVALDKMRHQGIKKSIVTVPQMSIGSSFQTTDLQKNGFEANWIVREVNNLCSSKEDSEQEEVSKTKIFLDFLQSDDTTLVCPHATFRNGCLALIREGRLDLLDDCLIGLDEFHHVSSDPNNRLGEILRQVMERHKSHVMAMTGTYFRGDHIPVLETEYEDRFKIVTYSFYQQLQSYKYLKALDITYEFYQGGYYLTGLEEILDIHKKTIIYIPHSISRYNTKDKNSEVGDIYSLIARKLGQKGDHKKDEETGFDIFTSPSGETLKVANLVNDSDEKARRKVVNALGKADRDKIDIIVSMKMASEGFDWIWCERVIVCGFRESFTDIVQIIGRATRDAPGKPRAEFVNLIERPPVETGNINEVVNDYLKGIGGSLLMEQVLTPNMKFSRQTSSAEKPPVEDDDNGIKINEPRTDQKDYKSEKTEKLRQVTMDFMKEAYEKKISHPDFVRPDTMPEDREEASIEVVNDQCREVGLTHDDVPEEDREELARDLRTQVHVPGIAREFWQKDHKEPAPMEKMVKHLLNVKKLNMELIDGYNPVGDGLEIIAKSMNEKLLDKIKDGFVGMRVNPPTKDEALRILPRIEEFTKDHHRLPDSDASDPQEKRLGEILRWLRDKKRQWMERKMRQEQEAKNEV